MGATVWHTFGKTPHLVSIYKHERAQGDTYELRWRVDGVPDYQGGYKDPTEAIKAGEQLHGWLVKGLTDNLPIGKAARERKVSSAVTRRKVCTLQDVFEAMLAERTDHGKIKDAGKYRYHWDHYVACNLEDDDGKLFNLKNYDVNNIDKAVITKWLRMMRLKPLQRGNGMLSDSSIAGGQRILRAVFQFGVDNQMIERNVAKLVDKRPSRKREVQWFHDVEEFLKIVPHIVKWARMPIVFTAFTGIRYGELVALYGDEFDMQTHRMHLLKQFDDNDEETGLKTLGSRAWVNMHPNLFKLMEGYFGQFPERAEPGVIVFPPPRHGHHIDNKSLNNALKAACKKAGITRNITFHGLRHTAATWLADANVPIHQIQELLRHADAETTRAYLHVSEAALRAASEAMPVPVMDIADFVED